MRTMSLETLRREICVLVGCCVSDLSMRAVTFRQFGGVEVLALDDIPRATSGPLSD